MWLLDQISFSVSIYPICSISLENPNTSTGSDTLGIVSRNLHFTKLCFDIKLWEQVKERKDIDLDVPYEGLHSETWQFLKCVCLYDTKGKVF